MTDQDEKVAQIHAIAQALYRLPPPARAMVATDLYDQGVRMLPELSTKRVVREGPAQLGNWAPGRLERNDAMDILQKMNPELADRVAAAHTEDQKAAIRDEIKAEFPDQIAQIEQHIADMDEEGAA